MLIEKFQESRCIKSWIIQLIQNSELEFEKFIWTLIVHALNLHAMTVRYQLHNSISVWQ